MFKISVAQWSLHRMLFDGELDNLDFPQFVKTKLGLDAVEYVNAFFKDKARDSAYLTELKRRCNCAGVKSLLIMIDGEGHLGDPDNAKRQQAVKNHHPWVEAAKFLGCHSIRVNAHSSGSREEQAKLAADGLHRLSEFAAPLNMNVLVENHGGLSSDGNWLSGVMRTVNLPNCGTLPDFGNFQVDREQDLWYDRYQGVEQLMPFAKAVSAKSHQFDSHGVEVRTDYIKMMRIVLDAGYDGYVGIEWEGDDPASELEGTLLTKRLLERVRQWFDSESTG